MHAWVQVIIGVLSSHVLSPSHLSRRTSIFLWRLLEMTVESVGLAPQVQVASSCPRVLIVLIGNWPGGGIKVL